MSTIDNKIIPNQLNVIINTSVPGYQKIEYKPYMTIPDISKDDKKIMFNPLFKLNKSYVDKVPENLRKKQFFNKGLFDSLLNFTNGTKASSLLQATRNGFVDNNIKITLDAIFPENSVLYINKKPYTIADFQWSKGNWKIDTKIKKSQLDSSKITDPALYQTVVKDEIISGENQLKSLPPGIIYGTNYTGPKDNTASGVAPPSKSTKIVKQLEDEDEEPIKVLTNLDSDDESIVQTSKKYPNVIEPIEKMFVSPRTTQSLRVFLKESRFFNLINTVYTASSKNTKIFIQKSLSESIILNVDDDIDELTKETYDKNVSEIKTIKNKGGGNCFFIAVADAINYHNYYNQKNRIISGSHGTGINLYTQKYLRELVFTYLQSWSELDSYLLDIAPLNAEELNNLFIQQLNGIQLALRESGKSDEITPDTYVGIANGIFNRRDNFLVKNIERVPIDVDEYNRPFKVIEEDQLKNYILSNDFWANEVVIYALCSELKLNIIPLESIKTPTRKSTLRVPYANFSPDINNWNKYLFLYYNQGHYELITFNQKTNVQKITNTGRITDKIILKKSKIIFDRNDNVSELPPIYILFTIFGSYFSSITNEADKLNFTFKKEIMLTIQNIINNTLYNKSYYSSFFYPAFKIYFPSSNIRKPINLIEPTKLIEPSKFLAIEPSKGGAYPRYNPYYRPAYYNPQYMAHNMEKRDKDSDDSQLAYTITIDMELRPGTSLSPAELTHAKCNSKWNSIRKSWSELSGNPYVIPPVYNKEETNKTQNTRPDPQNNTRKYFKGGKHNKTVKLY